MRFAMYVPNFGTFGSIHTLVTLAQAAETAGWDGFFLWDHLLPDTDSAHGPVVDPWIALTAVASATSRLRLGALVTAFPRRRPWKLARETGLWTGTPLTYQGTYYTVENAQFLPPPYQTPRIPIWIAGVWPGTRPFRRAARWDGVIPTGRNGTPGPDDIRQMQAYINHYRTATTPFDVAFQGRAHEVPAEERGRHVADYAAAGVTWWLEQVWPDVALAEVQSIIDQGPPSLIA